MLRAHSSGLIFSNEDDMYLRIILSYQELCEEALCEQRTRVSAGSSTQKAPGSIYYDSSHHKIKNIIAQASSTGIIQMKYSSPPQRMKAPHRLAHYKAAF
jgi:hypothetical protein